MHNNDCNNVRYLQPSEDDNEIVEISVCKGNQSGEEIVTDRSMQQHPCSSEEQTDLHYFCRETATPVGDTAVKLRDVPETCDTAADYGDSEEYEDVKFIQNDPCTVSTYTWEYLPHQLCRLCASTDEHPKQSIVGWLDMLNEVIPDMVSYLSFYLYLCLCKMT
jgi:hypothetical protein